MLGSSFSLRVSHEDKRKLAEVTRQEKQSEKPKTRPNENHGRYGNINGRPPRPRS